MRSSLALILFFAAAPALAQDGGVELTAPTVAVPASAISTCLSGPAEHLDACAQVGLDAIVNKQWGLLVSLAILLLIAGLRKWVPEGTKVGAWFRSKLGAIVVNFALSGLGAMVTALVAGVPFSVGLVLKAISVALTAAGGWAIYKNVQEAVAEKKAQDAGAAAAKNPGSITDA